MYPRGFPAEVKPAVYTTGCHFSSAVNWNHLRQWLSTITWQSALSPVLRFFVWWLIFTFHARNQWEDKLLICGQTELLWITARAKQIETNWKPSINAVIKPLQRFKMLYCWIKNVTNEGWWQFILEINSFTLFFKSQQNLPNGSEVSALCFGFCLEINISLQCCVFQTGSSWLGLERNAEEQRGRMWPMQGVDLDWRSVCKKN